MAADIDIHLAPLAEHHLTRTLAWANDPVLMRLMDRATPVSPSEHQAWFAALSTRNDCAYFAIEESAQRIHVGNVWLWAIDRRHRKAELRIVVGESAARGRGIGRRAIDQLYRHAIGDLGLHRIFAYVLTINPGAKAAFEGARFVVEGLLRHERRTDNGFVDVWLLARVAESGNDDR